MLRLEESTGKIGHHLLDKKLIAMVLEDVLYNRLERTQPAFVIL